MSTNDAQKKALGFVLKFKSGGAREMDLIFISFLLTAGWIKFVHKPHAFLGKILFKNIWNMKYLNTHQNSIPEYGIKLKKYFFVLDIN